MAERTLADPAVTRDADRTLGDLVAERPGRARVFESAGIDYCCHGQRTLAEACAAAGLDVGAIVVDLSAVTDDVVSDAEAFSPSELADHVVDTHHAYLHRELEPLGALADKVHMVHGDRHPELAEVARLVATLRADLVPHLAREETVVFPAIEASADGAVDEQTAGEIRRLVQEHRRLGEVLAQLRAVTGDYRVPVDACASYQGLYSRLTELESDTFRHVHLENNVLFPAVGVTNHDAT